MYTEIFYINIVEKLSWIPPLAGNPSKPLEDSNIVENIIEQCKSHPSIINIKNQENLNGGTDDFLHPALRGNKYNH